MEDLHPSAAESVCFIEPNYWRHFLAKDLLRRQAQT
jgi:hypothetical protein